MPDWTYHPFFKQLLFRMPPEDARRLTLRILEVQASSAVGRRVFRLFGHGLPPEELKVDVLGLTFPGPTGLGPGIDTDGTTLSVMQHLGFGFIEVGPLGEHAIDRKYQYDPLRLSGQWSLIHSPHACSPSASTVGQRIEQTPELSIPVGIALDGNESEIAGALTAAFSSASFFTLPATVAGDCRVFARLRAETDKPLLIRIPADWSLDLIDQRLDKLASLGLNGCVAVAGLPTPMLKDGEMDGPFLAPCALSAVEHIAKRYGDKLPVIGAGGVMSPGDALSLLDAGAKLIELYAGLVFAGPGLPGRIVHALEHRLHHSANVCAAEGGDSVSTTTEHITHSAIKPNVVCQQVVQPFAPDVPHGLRALGWCFIGFTGIALISSGLFAIILAATIQMLPYDYEYLGMTAGELCRFHGCHIVHFMAHDRVSFGGSIIAIGVLYCWLTLSPLRRGEAWAWWALLISGVLGFGSFLTYLSYGYLDIWHGIATLLLLLVFTAGLFLSFSGLRNPRGIGAVLRPGAHAWLWSPAGQGRALMLFTATGMILGGLTIMIVGMTRVFVPQDLEFMGMTIEEIKAINPHLISLIAHDRAGFGGGLCSTGMAILISVWCGTRPGAKGLWRAWLIAGIVGFVCAIGVHPIVGYNSLIHLLPAYVGALSFLAGMTILYRPMCRPGESVDTFPDF